MASKKWNLSIGLINIPIRVENAIKSKSGTSMKLLHHDCLQIIKQIRICPTCEEARRLAMAVPPGSQLPPSAPYPQELTSVDLTHGYPLDKKTFVPISDEELDAFEASSGLEIIGFAKTAGLGVGNIYLDGSHYVGVDTETDKKGQLTRAFVLFVQAMIDMNVVAIGKCTFTNREHLCMLVPGNGMLVMHPLHYAEEIKAPDQFQAFANLSPKEIEMGKSLIQSMVKDIDINSFTDEYKAKLLKLVEAKANGEILPSAPVPVAAPEMSLEDLLAGCLAAANAEPVK